MGAGLSICRRGKRRNREADWEVLPAIQIGNLGTWKIVDCSCGREKSGYLSKVESTGLAHGLEGCEIHFHVMHRITFYV